MKIKSPDWARRWYDYLTRLWGRKRDPAIEVPPVEPPNTANMEKAQDRYADQLAEKRKHNKKP